MWKKIEMKFWTRYVFYYSLLFRARPGAGEIINELRKQGNKVFIVTSKACALEKSYKKIVVRLLFRLSLLLNGIHVDGIEYCSLANSAQDKLKVCKRKSIRVMVEDKKILKNLVRNYLFFALIVGTIRWNLIQMIMNKTDLGFRDYIQMEDNIIVYCGSRGTFTDIFRKGNSKDRQQILKSFQRDFEYMKAFLMQVYLDNPKAQVYVCGLPDIQGIRLTNLFDIYIKKAIKTVPNAVYVKGVSNNIFTINSNQKELDYHYNKPEYMNLLCEIWKAVLDNYISMKFKNEVLIGLA